MKFRVMGLVGLGLLLCGCTDADWDHALSYVSSTPSDAPVVQAQTDAPPPIETASLPPTPSPPAEASPSANAVAVAAPPQLRVSEEQTVTAMTPLPATRYCKSVALNSGGTATRDGLDGPAQQQAVDAVFRQCMHFYDAPIP